jgi:hypothetical protein
MPNRGENLVLKDYLWGGEPPHLVGILLRECKLLQEAESKEPKVPSAFRRGRSHHI